MVKYLNKGLDHLVASFYHHSRFPGSRRVRENARVVLKFVSIHSPCLLSNPSGIQKPAEMINPGRKAIKPF